jgi:hypothetical protein
VFEVGSPDGARALKIYDPRFSTGEKGAIELKRIEQQLALRGHDCPYLVQVYEGGGSSRHENKPVIAAVNGCATQKQEQNRVFQHSVRLDEPRRLEASGRIAQSKQKKAGRSVATTAD